MNNDPFAQNRPNDTSNNPAESKSLQSENLGDIPNVQPAEPAEQPPGTSKGEQPPTEAVLHSQVEEVSSLNEEPTLPEFLLEEDEPEAGGGGDSPTGESPPPQKPLDTLKNKLSDIPLSRILIIVGGIFILLFFMLMLLPLLKKGKQTPSGTPQVTQKPYPQTTKTTINIWGLWYPKDAMQQIIAEFENKHPDIRVNYIQQDYQHTSVDNAYVGEYFKKAYDRITQEGGVDIVEVHHSWLPLIINHISAAPKNILDPNSVSKIYYPGISDIIIQKNGVIGVPLFADTLVMFYNADIVDPQLIAQINTWDDLIQQIPQIKSKGAIALGTFSNIFHSPELFLLFMIQNGTPYYQKGRYTLQNKEALSALTFYRRFYTQHQTWTPTMPNDLKYFAECIPAIIFAPSWRYINFINSNPNLEIKIAPVPKLGGASRKQNLGSFWLFVVPKNSSKQEAAWQFLSYLIQPENIEKIYNSQKELMKEGQTYARVDMANRQNDPYHTVVHQNLNTAVFPIVPTYGLWESSVKETFSKVDRGEADLNTTLAQLENLLNTRLKGLAQR